MSRGVWEPVGYDMQTFFSFSSFSAGKDPAGLRRIFRRIRREVYPQFYFIFRDSQCAQFTAKKKENPKKFRTFFSHINGQEKMRKNCTIYAEHMAGWGHMGGKPSPDGLRDDHKGEHGGTPYDTEATAQDPVQDALQPPPTPSARYRLRRSGKRLPCGKAMIARAAGDDMAPHNGHEPRFGQQLLVSVDDIRQVLHLPAVEAAKELSMSARTLRRYCRKFGIKRWPYRKLGLVSAEIRKRIHLNHAEETMA